MSVKIRTVIADDEELARRGLRSLSLRCPDLELLCECRNGRETVDAIHRHRPDLVFLDIQNARHDGVRCHKCPRRFLPLARCICHRLTDKFALRAFEVHALDYLLKPVNEERFDAALARCGRPCRMLRINAIVQRVRQVTADLQVATPRSVPAANRLPIRVNGRIILIRSADIDWIEADRDYVSVHVGGKSLLMRETIAAVELRLAPSGFVRIHRRRW